jgi:hypothetical protein
MQSRRRRNLQRVACQRVIQALVLDTLPVHVLHYDTTKAARILGLKYHTIAETTKDTLADYEAKRW